VVSAPSLIRTAILSGATATGKTEIALEFARAMKKRGTALEIINADSLLVFRSMNIGTAKPSPGELAEIPHHLIDIREPGESFTAGDFSRQVLDTLESLNSRRIRALIVGGSGFYLKALLYGLWEGAPASPELRAELEKIPSQELYEQLYARDSESALRIGVNDRYRLVRAHELMRLTGKTPTALQAEQNRVPDPRLSLLVIDRPAEDLHTRIHRRTLSMVQAGLLDEVREIRSRFPEARSLDSIGYAQACAYLDGVAPAGRKTSPGEAGLIEEIELATRQLVKRQRTWFKSEPSAERFELERDRAAVFKRLEAIYF
jgi:tRNA dimethylallyltransferase